MVEKEKREEEAMDFEKPEPYPEDFDAWKEQQTQRRNLEQQACARLTDKQLAAGIVCVDDLLVAHKSGMRLCTYCLLLDGQHSASCPIGNAIAKAKEVA